MVLQPCNETLLNNENKWTIYSYNNLNESGKNYGERNKSIHTTGGNVKSHYRIQYGGSSEKIKEKITLWSNNFTFGYLAQKIENRVWKRYLLTRVHGSIICSSLEVEATQMSISRWMDKQNIVYI